MKKKTAAPAPLRPLIRRLEPRTPTRRLAVWLFALMALALACLPLAHGQSPVVQRGYDAGVSGATLTETTLNTSNVVPGSFGLVFTLPVDDNVMAQPLYVPNVVINQVAHNVLYVATMNDTLYAFDADTGGAPLWQFSLSAFENTTSVPIANFAYSGNKNIINNLGILSTPVIDLPTNTMYVVACTLEGGTLVYRLHAVDITNGVPRANSGVVIGGSYKLMTFNARNLWQRVSLILVGNNVVFALGALELESTGHLYSGWVMAYDKGSLMQTGIFATETTGNGGAGVWQSGRPPAVDSQGFVYVITGNAYTNGYDGVNNFSESFLKLNPAQGLALADSFTPSNWLSMDNGDADLTSSGPMLVPNSSLIVGGGKTGVLYVLNSGGLGGNTANDTGALQKIQASASELRGGPVYWQRSAANGGPLLYNWGVSDRLKAFAFSNGTFATTPVAQGNLTNQIFPGGILTLSANGEAAGSGIVWATVATSGNAEDQPPTPGALYAFDAGNVATQLWNSNLNASHDAFGNFAKFVPPMVANGRVYVATWSKQVAVYGLSGGGGGGKPAPSVSGIAPNSGSMNGGTAVQITGQNFQANAAVSFGGTAAGSVVVVNATTITAKTAPHKQGPVNVVVTNTDQQTGTLAHGFMYTKH